MIDLRPLLVVGCLGSAFLLQGPLGRANAARRVDDYSFLPEAGFLKVVAGAHRSTAADLTWLGALPNISKQFLDEERKQRKKVWLAAMLETVTDLEPEFATPYIYGAHYLWLAHNDKQASIALLRKGARNNPTYTEILRQLGTAHHQVGDKVNAMRVYEQAVAQPDCDQLTKMVLAILKVKGGDDLAALKIFEPLLASKDPLLREFAERDFEKAKKQIAIRAAQTFEERHDRPPRSVDELREPGLMLPEVVDLVLQHTVVHPDGRLEFPMEYEYDLKNQLRALEYFCQIYYNEHGRHPTIEEIYGNELARPMAPPEGQRWATEKGKVWLEDIPAGEEGHAEPSEGAGTDPAGD